MRLFATMILALALAVGVTVTMTGCTDMTQRSTVAREQLRQAKALEQNYEEALEAPTFTILTGKVDLHQAFYPDKDPCAGVSEDRLPTAEERVALKHWSRLNDLYLDKFEAVTMIDFNGTSQFKEALDRFNAVMDNALRSQAVLISVLAEGRLTYCQFATEDKDLTENVVRETKALSGDLKDVMGLENGLFHYTAFTPNGHNP